MGPDTPSGKANTAHDTWEWVVLAKAPCAHICTTAAAGQWGCALHCKTGQPTQHTLYTHLQCPWCTWLRYSCLPCLSTSADLVDLWASSCQLTLLCCVTLPVFDRRHAGTTEHGRCTPTLQTCGVTQAVLCAGYVHRVMMFVGAALPLSGS